VTAETAAGVHVHALTTAHRTAQLPLIILLVDGLSTRYHLRLFL